MNSYEMTDTIGRYEARIEALEAALKALWEASDIDPEPSFGGPNRGDCYIVEIQPMLELMDARKEAQKLLGL
jgi:hypothetical protein